MQEGISHFTLLVPAHLGVKGNETPNKGTKQACNSLNSPIPDSDIKLVVNSSIRQKWQREWDGQTESKLKEIKPCIVIWSTFTLRKIYAILTRLRIGHSRLTHRHLL